MQTNKYDLNDNNCAEGVPKLYTYVSTEATKCGYIEDREYDWEPVENSVLFFFLSYPKTTMRISAYVSSIILS